MKALLFTGGEAPNMDKVKSFLDGDFIAAADSGLLAAKMAALSPNLIIGDMDSLQDKSLLLDYPRAEVICLERAKDLTDTEAALRLLKERGFSEITLIGAGGGRIDHFFAVLRLFETDFAPSLWLSNMNAAAFLQSAKDSALLASGLTKGDEVSVFSVGEAPHKIEGENLRWQLDIPWDSEDKNRTIRDSLSNWAESDTVKISCIEGDFLCFFPLKESLKLERVLRSG